MKKYFVIGNPIEHSLSPELHNFWIKKNNINATYEKIKLNDSDLSNFINKLKKYNFPVGLSDHTIGSIVAISSVGLGVRIFEKHFKHFS